ncbi:MAG: hypothetical protein Q9170_008199, partial [Blastenia crenularia]
MGRGKDARRGKSARSTGKGKSGKESLNNAYRDMLAEAEVNSSPTQTGDEGRPLKRRRVRGHIVTQEESEPDQTKSPAIVSGPLTGKQGTLIQDREPASSDDELEVLTTADQDHPSYQEQTALKDDSSDESDFAWEEVDLAQDQDADQSEQEPMDKDEGGNMDLVLEFNGRKSRENIVAARRKTLTAAERRIRLDIHKKILYRRLPKDIVSLLNPDEQLAQFRQDESFRKGLEKACEYFKDAFNITARGMSRAYWADDVDSLATQPPSDLDLPMQKQDILDCAKQLEGSSDVGAQLFCALLRSAGVDTRLVCSLQVLPLTTTAKGVTPQKQPRKPIHVIDYSHPSPPSAS